jgi:YidC/Oxa1 family membrane protein insertase
MDLGQPDSTLIMAVLVGASTFVQQRMTTPTSASADPQQQSVNQTMMWMMPLMFAFFTLQFPSGLALYWTATNVVGIAMQYFYQGPSNFSWRKIISMSPAPAPTPAARSAQQEQHKVESAEVEEAGEPQEEAAQGGQRRRRRRRGRRRR